MKDRPKDRAARVREIREELNVPELLAEQIVAMELGEIRGDLEEVDQDGKTVSPAGDEPTHREHK